MNRWDTSERFNRGNMSGFDRNPSFNFSEYGHSSMRDAMKPITDMGKNAEKAFMSMSGGRQAAYLMDRAQSLGQAIEMPKHLQKTLSPGRLAGYAALMGGIDDKAAAPAPTGRTSQVASQLSSLNASTTGADGKALHPEWESGAQNPVGQLKAMLENRLKTGVPKQQPSSIGTAPVTSATGLTTLNMGNTSHNLTGAPTSVASPRTGSNEAQRFAHGGQVHGPQGVDQVPARLSEGEYVLPKDTVQAVGAENLEALRQATHTPRPDEGIRRALGGYVGGTTQPIRPQQFSFLPQEPVPPTAAQTAPPAPNDNLNSWWNAQGHKNFDQKQLESTMPNQATPARNPTESWWKQQGGRNFNYNQFLSTLPTNATPPTLDNPQSAPVLPEAKAYMANKPAPVQPPQPQGQFAGFKQPIQPMDGGKGVNVPISPQRETEMMALQPSGPDMNVDRNKSHLLGPARAPQATQSSDGRLSEVDARIKELENEQFAAEQQRLSKMSPAELNQWADGAELRARNNGANYDTTHYEVAPNGRLVRKSTLVNYSDQAQQQEAYKKELTAMRDAGDPYLNAPGYLEQEAALGKMMRPEAYYSPEEYARVKRQHDEVKERFAPIVESNLEAKRYADKEKITTDAAIARNRAMREAALETPEGKIAQAEAETKLDEFNRLRETRAKAQEDAITIQPLTKALQALHLMEEDPNNPGLPTPGSPAAAMIMSIRDEYSAKEIAAMKPKDLLSLGIAQNILSDNALERPWFPNDPSSSAAEYSLRELHAAINDSLHAGGSLNPMVSDMVIRDPRREGGRITYSLDKFKNKEYVQHLHDLLRRDEATERATNLGKMNWLQRLQANVADSFSEDANWAPDSAEYNRYFPNPRQHQKPIPVGQVMRDAIGY